MKPAAQRRSAAEGSAKGGTAKSGENRPHDVLVDHDLEAAIPYLLARAGMRMGQAFSQELKKFNLSLVEWRTCAALHHLPHQRLSDLMAHTSAEASTLSRVVEGLVQRKLLTRDRSDDDARALALSLTPAGIALTQRIIPLAQLYERVALSGLSSAETKALREALRRVYDNMEMLDPRE